VSTPNIGHPYSRLKFLLNGQWWAHDPSAYESVSHFTPLTDWLLEMHLKSAGFDSITVSYAGSLKLPSRFYALAYALSKPLLALIGRLPRPREDDGVCTIAVARRPG
jgi:hypothetical protein